MTTYAATQSVDVGAVQQPPKESTPGLEAVSECLAKLRDLSASHPDWYDRFEYLDPDVCTHADLISLLETAPTEMAKGFLFGKLSLRRSIAAITGRPML